MELDAPFVNSGSVAQVELSPRQQAELDWFDTCWGESFHSCSLAFAGTTLAAGCYPTTAWGLVVLGLVFTGQGLSVEPVMWTFAIMVAVFGGLAAMSVTLVAGPVAALIVASFNASLSFPLRARAQVALTGGLTGFGCVTLLIQAFEIPPRGPWDLLLPYALGPLLAGILGQVAALRFASEGRTFVTRDTPPQRTGRPQYRLQHLMVLMTWLALVFALTSWLGTTALIWLGLACTQLGLQIVGTLGWQQYRERVAEASTDSAAGGPIS